MKLLERIRIAFFALTGPYLAILFFKKPPEEGDTLTVGGRVAEFTLPRDRHDQDYDYWTIKAMLETGGSFVKRLASMAETADSANLTKIKRTWREYWDEYEAEGQTMRYRACPSGLCDGSRELAIDVDDGEGNTMRGAGTQKCPHGDV